MPKKSKEKQLNLFYVENGQARGKEEINEAVKRKKAKEREKRIKENKRQKQINDFDLETETVIQMTNKNKIKKEEEKRRKLTRQEQKRRKKIKRIKFVLKLILLIGLIVGGIIFALTSPIFNIKDIKVLNNNIVPSDTIISLSEIKTEENIFKFYSRNVIQKIKENPYIENVKIHRKFLSTVEIEVEERTPEYSVDYMGKYAYINTQGYILEISEDSKNLPIIQGIVTSEEEVKPGTRLNNEDLSKLEDVIKIMNSATENGLDGKVTSIDISEKNEYIIYLNEDNKKVHLGDSSNLSNKMLYIIAILEQEKGKEGDIFVNGDLNNNKFRPYFREKV